MLDRPVPLNATVGQDYGQLAMGKLHNQATVAVVALLTDDRRAARALSESAQARYLRIRWGYVLAPCHALSTPQGDLRCKRKDGPTAVVQSWSRVYISVARAAT